MKELSYRSVAWAVVVLAVLSGCTTASESLSWSTEDSEEEDFFSWFGDYEADLKDIIARDTLRAITPYSSTSYFLYKGEPMGYEYEMASALAKSLGVHLKMIIAEDMDAIFHMLNEGEGDIIAYNVTVTSRRKQVVDFTEPLNFTHQVLVQRKPDNWREMKLHNIEKTLIRNPTRLINKKIHIRRNTAYNDRLVNLQEEIGGKINVQYLPGDLSTDEIIRMVSNGEIDYTIADYDIAKINQSYYTNLDIHTNIGVTQQMGWAVRKGSPQLKKAVNLWLKKNRNSEQFNVAYNKYFENSRAFTTRIKSEFYSKESNKISEYDPILKAAARTINWDWRMLASQVYQESQFDPSSKSWAGATGLMQLMPRTAKSYGYTDLTNPEVSVEAGVKHLKFLENYWQKDIADSVERVKFILASYNAGQNHVQDARRLARKRGKNPNIWYGHVEECLLLIGQKKYFTDPVVKYGYCRGEEPVGYVKEIIERYGYYQQFIHLDDATGDQLNQDQMVAMVGR